MHPVEVKGLPKVVGFRYRDIRDIEGVLGNMRSSPHIWGLLHMTRPHVEGGLGNILNMLHKFSSFQLANWLLEHEHGHTWSDIYYSK